MLLLLDMIMYVGNICIYCHHLGMKANPCHKKLRRDKNKISTSIAARTLVDVPFALKSFVVITWSSDDVFGPSVTQECF